LKDLFTTACSFTYEILIKNISTFNMLTFSIAQSEQINVCIRFEIKTQKRWK